MDGHHSQGVVPIFSIQDFGLQHILFWVAMVISVSPSWVNTVAIKLISSTVRPQAMGGNGHIPSPPFGVHFLPRSMFFLSYINTHNTQQTAADKGKRDPQCHMAVISCLRSICIVIGCRFRFNGKCGDGNTVCR